MLIVYIIFTAVILLNGLIGIFGQAFTLEDEEIDESLVILKKMTAQFKTMETDMQLLKRHVNNEHYAFSSF